MSPRRPALRSTLALAAALTLGAPSARAQGAPPARAQATAEEKAAAESLFKRALGLMARGDPAGACPVFEEVVRLTGGLGAEYELAKCYEASGRVASAWALYREVAQRDRGRRAKQARAAAARLGPALARLTVEVPAPVASLAGLEVRRDGRPLLREVWGVSVPIDPGEHRLEASAPGKAPWATQLSIERGESRSIAVGPLGDQAPAASSPPPTPAVASARLAVEQRGAPADRGAPRGRTQRIVGLGVAGAGLAALGVGVALGLDAKAKYDAQRESEACGDDNVCTAEGDRASRDARARGDLGTIVGGAGLAALVGGFVLYVASPSPRGDVARRPSLTLQPGAGRGVASLALAGAW